LRQHPSTQTTLRDTRKSLERRKSTPSVGKVVRRIRMSRHHPTVLSLAVLFALSTLLFAVAGCGGDSQEQELKQATAAVAAKREAVQEARDEVETRQQVVDEAQKQLEAAESELRMREQALREAESDVGLKATDPALFRSVQRRLLDDEELDELAIAVQVTKGVVTLQGTVPDEKDRARAEEVARTTPGVVTIENRIQLVSPPAKE
jgi:osmotically-inducible protein OsmY